MRVEPRRNELPEVVENSGAGHYGGNDKGGLEPDHKRLLQTQRFGACLDPDEHPKLDHFRRVGCALGVGIGHVLCDEGAGVRCGLRGFAYCCCWVSYCGGGGKRKSSRIDPNVLADNLVVFHPSLQICRDWSSRGFRYLPERLLFVEILEGFFQWTLHVGYHLSGKHQSEDHA